MEKKILSIVGVFALIIIIALAITSLIDFDKVPAGAGNDYYDIIDDIEDGNPNVFVFADEVEYKDEKSKLDFYNHISYNTISDFDTLPRINGKANILIIDMVSFETTASLDDFATVMEYYEECHYTVIFLNNDKAQTNYLESFETEFLTRKYLITFTWDEEDSQKHIINNGDMPSKAIMTYKLLRLIDAATDQFESIK